MVDSENDIEQIQKDITCILSSVSFQLRKWTSNHFTLLNKFTMKENLDGNILLIADNINN